MNIVYNFIVLVSYNILLKLVGVEQFTQCSPEVSPYDVIFCSILVTNIAYYHSLPKTLNLTPSEPMRYPG
jgi:hypothetical protein